MCVGVYLFCLTPFDRAHERGSAGVVAELIWKSTDVGRHTHCLVFACVSERVLWTMNKEKKKRKKNKKAL